MDELQKIIPEIVESAWRGLGDARNINSIIEVSANVSTNQVYRLEMNDHSSVIAKVSSYGSYFQFREDHDRIHLWNRLLSETEYRSLLSDGLSRNNRVYTYYGGDHWVVFYYDVPISGFLPRILPEEYIANLGREIGRFHRKSLELSPRIPPTSKSIKSDIIYLMDLVRNRHSRRRFGVRKKLLDVIQDQCLKFLMNIDDLGYDYMPHIPLLLDWNLGNFSVEYLPENQNDRFRLFSRWDYDWFRIEPRLLDFYFCSRVSSSVGDRTVFSYLPDPLLEERFRLFLKHYHAVCPLTETDLLFVKEAYRFFILNYVIKEGNHFFKEDIIHRLKLEALEVYLPGLEQLDFRILLSVLDEPAINQ